MIKGIVNGVEKDITRIPMKGKNLFDKTDTKTTEVSGVYTYTLKGLTPNESYTCTTNFTTTSNVASIYFGGTSTGTNGVTASIPKTMTADSNGNIVLYVRYASLGTTAPPVYNDLMDGTLWIMVNEGSTAQPYEPYGYQEGWEVRKGDGTLIWGRNDTISVNSGTLPIKGYGVPLVSITPEGNSEQSGTPTPASPIDVTGCGDRTGNLFDGIYTVAIMSVSGSTATLYTASPGRTAIVKCEPNTTYTVKKYGVSNRFIIAESDIKPVSGTAMSIILNDSSKTEYSFTTSNTARYVGIYCSTSSEQAEPPLMLNLGSTAFHYEPYGYKVALTANSTTTPIYLGQTPSVRRIKKLVLTGEETIDAYDASYSRFSISIPDSLIIGVRLTPAASSHYLVISDGRSVRDVPDNSIYSDSNNASHRWFIKTTDYTDATAYKSYLAQQYAAGTPVTIWYILSKPTTGIVNEPLMKIGTYADTLTVTDQDVAITPRSRQ